MTTEEMNRVIAEYIGMRFHDNGTVSHYPTVMKLNMGVTTVNELTFHTDWNAIHFTWQKLRGELGAVHYLKISNAILDTDITTAHRLMVEAIEIIKK